MNGLLRNLLTIFQQFRTRGQRRKSDGHGGELVDGWLSGSRASRPTGRGHVDPSEIPLPSSNRAKGGEKVIASHHKFDVGWLLDTPNKRSSLASPLR